MTPERSDLLDECLAGSQEAWERLVREYGGLVYTVPSRLGLPPEGCEEVFQSVFALLVERLDSIRDHKALAAWLITVARRQSTVWRQREHRAHRGDPRVPPPDESPADEDLGWLEEAVFVRQVLDRLGEPCRSLLTLLIMEEPRPAYVEIARRLDMPVGSIGPMRARCLRKFAEAYQKATGETPEQW